MKEKHKLLTGVFRKQLVRKMFGFKIENGTEHFRMLHKVLRTDVHKSPVINRVVK